MTTDLPAAVERFFDEEILPRHRQWAAHVSARNGTPPFVAELKAEEAVKREPERWADWLAM